MRYDFIEFDGVRYRPDEIELEIRQEQVGVLDNAGEMEYVNGPLYCTLYGSLPSVRLHMFSGPVNFGHKLVGGVATLVVLPATS